MTVALTSLSPQIQEAVQATREKVAKLHEELPANDLVVWTAGNVSERVAGADLFVIKPSGVRYDELSADVMVVCDLDGNKIDDGTPAHSFSTLMAELGSLVRNTCRTPSAGPTAPTFDIVTTPNATQRHALDLVKQIRP